MPFFDHISGNMTSSLRILLISTTVLSAAMVLKLSVPTITEFAVSDVPSIWNGVVSWLKPPYLYLVINCIIITIVATTKLQSKFDDVSAPPHLPHDAYVQVQPAAVFPAKLAYDGVVEAVPPSPHIPIDAYLHVPPAAVFPSKLAYDGVVEATPTELPPPTEVLNGSYNQLDFDVYGRVDAKVSETESAFTVKAASPLTTADDEMEKKRSNEFVISKSSWAPVSNNPPEYSPVSAQKPPSSARFSHRRKASVEGGKAALGVSKPKKQDTLENTWKTITEGRAMPLTRHLKKSDTWEMQGRRHNETTTAQKMTKSETFKDHSETSTLSRSPSLSKLKKEPSLSQDDLNKRVEAFIKKFNEDMRLQRQESLNQYMEMINRGAH